MRPIRIFLAPLLAAALLVACSRDDEPVATPSAPAPAPPPAAVEPLPALFAAAELEQMLAPIALFPDPLLAQVLMAATYPGEVADAARRAQQHPDASGDAAVLQVTTMPWDPSVQALAAFPQVLSLLGQDAAWVQRLGDAFLADPDAVLDAVQRLRRRARDAGNLASNEYVDVGIELTGAEDATVTIAPVDDELVYVPDYDPNEIYGDWPYDDYLPVYYPPSSVWYPGAGAGAIVRWGVAIAIADALWGRLTWGGDDIDIDVDRYNALNREALDAGARWQHDARHRDGVPYRDPGSRERYGRQLADPASRDRWRGDAAADALARAEVRATRERAANERAAADRAAGDRAAADRAAAADYAERAARGEVAIRPSEREQVAEQRRLAEADTRNRANAERQQQRDVEQARVDAARDASRAQQRTWTPPPGNAFDGSRRPAEARAERDRGDRSRPSPTHDRAAAGAGRPVARPVRARGGGRVR